MIDLSKLDPTEAERIAYTEGFTMAAQLFARIAELEALIDPDMEDNLRGVQSELEDTQWELEEARDEICRLESRIADLEANR
jgi:polyhydroxyalkanoate synthesis regulator phasin